MKEDFNSLQRSLTEHYDPQEAQGMMKLLAMHYLGITSLQWFTKDFGDVETERYQELVVAVDRLLQNEPLQYIVGEADFYGFTFHVSPSVLIPRPETEELIEWILTTTEDGKKILDIGTGSGCIPITLKKHLPKSLLSAIDYSLDAIKVAKQNAELLQVDVEFLEDNALALSQDMIDRKWDVIVSNPPYIRTLEKDEMRDNVLLHEPDMALFVSNDDPLIFYREIGKYGISNLNDGGTLFFEINQYLGEEMVSLLNDLGYREVTLRKDLSGNDRMVRAVK
ncbi:peptide chain release factor N(5)-glutamine methyltransferase [Halosquirtibacter xylanolyticus]|uniref:peptide chain release factor N(5)-glutamine methyltransferase n=1 Tax=Halosquirtibacter xylanolyticus TaxID=3374599 RepID=UPI00374A042D|nr:peptide chain release factor N(5)-glutamine methyltransferase [Prolixibacteraceae bacterium]